MTLFKFLSRKLYKSITVILPYTMMANMTAIVNYENALYTREMRSSSQILTAPVLCLKP